MDEAPQRPSTRTVPATTAPRGERLVRIPVLDDWSAVAVLLRELDEVFVRLGTAAEVLLIDDGSTTDPIEFAERAGQSESFALRVGDHLHRFEHIARTDERTDERGHAGKDCVDPCGVLTWSVDISERGKLDAEAQARLIDQSITTLGKA
jgi:hypothetical protein